MRGFPKHSPSQKWLVAIVCLFSLIAALQAQDVAATESRRLIIKPKALSGADAKNPARAMMAQSNRSDAMGRARVKMRKRFVSLRGIEVLEVESGQTVEKAMAQLKASGLYEYVEPDVIVKINAAPNDINYTDGTLWGMNNTGQNSGTADADIDAPEAWDVRTDASNIIVAVIDTGIRQTHEDLAANLWTNPGEIPNNGIDDDQNGYIDDVHGINAITGTGNPEDDHGHGTHCAGTIGGVGNNGKGVAGVAWNVKLMACKFIGNTGSGYTSDALKCIDYAKSHGAQIMSNSWGNGKYSQALYDAISAARDSGIIFVAAAGNSAADVELEPMYPGSYALDNIVSVAATTRTDELASFSNYGFGFTEIAAPGKAITSCSNTTDTAYKSLDGTSMACPHVSGALALAKAQFPGDDYRQLISRLQRTADPAAKFAGKTQSGRLNLNNLLRSTDNSRRGDAFADAIVLPPGGTWLRTSNRGATAEASEPAHAGMPAAHSVWFQWTPPVTGNAVVSTAGTNFDTVLAVYTGSTISALTPVASNDDTDTATTSRVNFNTVAGATYFIVFDGKAGRNGDALLRVGRPPGNDDFANATPLAGETDRVTSTNFGASVESGEPQLVPGIAGTSSVWWKWTAPHSGTFALGTTGSAFDTIAAVFTGTTLGNLARVASNDDEGTSTTTSLAPFSATAGVTYYFAVAGKQGIEGNISLQIAPLPSNDAFASARALTGNVAVDSTYNIFATREPGEPQHAGNPGGRSIWWTWTAPATGLYTIETTNSDFDTVLGVYTGASVGALTEIASNDDKNQWFQTSILQINAVAGTTYSIAVDGFDGAVGKVSLLLYCPDIAAPNDNFANRIVLTTPFAPGDLRSSAYALAHNFNATSEADEPQEGGGNTVWYTWTAPVTGTVHLETTGGGVFLPFFTVFTGTDFLSMNYEAVGVPTDSDSPLGSDADFSVTAGTEYQIQVDGWYSTGVFQLTLDFARANTAPTASAATISAPRGPFPGGTVEVSSVTTNDAENDPITLEYQWESSADGYAFSEIPGAISRTRQLTLFDVGTFFRCRVTSRDWSLASPSIYTAVKSVRNRPSSAARHGMAFSYTPSIPLPSQTTFTNRAIINEASQGSGNTSTEWVELLTLRDSDLRGWKLKTTSTGNPSMSFTDHPVWSAVPAGTLVIVRQPKPGSGSYDPRLVAAFGSPPADDLNPFDDGRMVVESSSQATQHGVTANLFSGSWPAFATTAQSITLLDSTGGVIDAIHPGSTNASLNPRPPTIGTNGFTRFGGDTEAEADVTSQWASFRLTSTPAPAEVSSPGVGNTADNAAWIANIRAGLFKETLSYRFAAGSATVPGLTLNPTTGLLSGTPNVPAGGIFHITIERYGTSSGMASQQAFDLLVSDANGIYTLSDGQTWTLSGDWTLDGPFANNGTLLSGPYVLTSNSNNFASWLINKNAMGGANDDEDFDGLTNLLEYALDLNPLLADSAGSTCVGDVEVDGNRYLTITFTRRKPPTDVTCTPEASSNLVNWSAAECLIHSVSDDGNGLTETVVARDTLPISGNGRRFLRLRVALAP